MRIYLSIHTLLFFALIFPRYVTSSERKIFTTLIPQKWVVDRIVGERFEVVAVVGKGKDPHTFEISPSLLREIGKASVYFSFGFTDAEMNLIKRLKKTFPNLKIVDISKGVKKERIENHHHHHHGDYDPHIWLSPLNMKIVASNVLDEIIKIDPEAKEFYTENYGKLIEELDKLHSEIQQILSPVRGKKFLVFHSAFKYFEREYGVIEVSIEREGKEPSPRELAKIISEAKKDNIKVIFAQPAFPSSSVKVIADEIKAKIIEFDHLDYNYIENLKKFAILIREAYGEDRGN